MFKKKCSFCGNKMSKGKCNVCGEGVTTHIDETNTLYSYQMIELEENKDDELGIEEEYQSSQVEYQEEENQIDEVQQEENQIDEAHQAEAQQIEQKYQKANEYDDEDEDEEVYEEDDSDIHYQQIDYTDQTQEVVTDIRKSRKGFKTLLFILGLVLSGCIGYAVAQYGLLDQVLAMLPR